MTAENPGNSELSVEENARRNAELKAILDEEGYTYREIDGFYDRPEKSFFVKDIPVDKAMELGKKFDQESVAHSVGMLYTTGKNANKMEPTKGQVVTDQDLNNFFSTIQTGDGPKKYQVVYDFGNFVDIPKSVDAKRAGQNINYGEEIANDNDVMLSNDGSIPIPPRQEETDTFESRSRSVFDVDSLVERALTADPSVRPEGSLLQDNTVHFRHLKT